MATKKQRVCDARDCDKKFVPRIASQRFHSEECKNREAQRRFREREQAKAVNA
jgi:hypothetical protein